MNRGLSRGVAPAVLAVLAISHVCSPQPALSASKSRVALNQIIVDVVVTDRSNRPVTGLRQQDFQVFENNKRQTIRSFEEHATQVTPAIPKPDLPENTFTNTASIPPDSVSVILLDQLNTSVEDQRLARQSVINFIAHKPPGDAFAIFTLRNDEEACHPNNLARASFGITDSPPPESDFDCPSRGELLLVQGITQDRDRLIAALKTELVRPRATQLRPMPGSAFGSRFNPWTLAPAPPPVPIGRAFVPFAAYQAIAYGLPSPSFDNYGTGPLEVYDTAMWALAEIGHFLQELPGRKSLIWMSDSFDAAPIAQSIQIIFAPKFKGWENTDPFSPTQMIHLAADRLALARVAVYLVDLNGKNSDVDVKRSCGGIGQVPGTLLFTRTAVPITTQPYRSSCDNHSFRLAYVTAQTGGALFHGGQKTQDALSQASSDESIYYSLAYSPTSMKFDGSVRNIKVTLSGKKYKLAYRKRFYADDPSTVNPPATAESPDLVLPIPSGPVPWSAVRISNFISSSNESDEPILSALRYGAPESNEVVFSAHLGPTDKLVEASPDLMTQLQDYESFRAERVQNAMEHLTSEQKKKQHKGRTVLDTLPPAEPVFVQPYSIDLSLPVQQLTLTPEKNGDHAMHLEFAILAYDALGKRVTGLKDTIDDTISESELHELGSKGYALHETIEIPDRVTLLRLGVREVSSNRIGSLEVPVWAISSPYRRQQLELPLNVGGLPSLQISNSPITKPN